MIRKTLLPLVVAATAACSTTPAENARGIYVELGSTSCRIDGQEGDVPTIVAAWLARNGSPKDVAVIGTGTTPYRCIGEAIFSLQRLGAKRVRFHQVHE